MRPRQGREPAVAAPVRSGRIRVMLAIDGLGLGGAEMVVRDLVRCVDREAFDVCVCCTKTLGGAVGDELLSQGYDVFVLPGREGGGVDYWTSLKLRRAVRDRGVDIVHTHSVATIFDGSACKLTMLRLKVLHTFHFGNYPYSQWRPHVMEGLCTRIVDKVIAVGWEQRCEFNPPMGCRLRGSA